MGPPIELLFIGITTYDMVVITAFMIGLAAGSLVLGRVADRHRAPLRIYGWLEIGIGVYAVATPWLFPGLQTLYSQVAASWGITATAGHLLRFTLALVALLIPTFMMGGTLPLFVRGLTRNLDGLATSTARLYGLNTLGATVGAFTAGYLLLPAVGVRNTIFVAAVLSIGAGLGVFLANRIRESAQSTGGSTKQGRDRLAPTLPGDVQGRALSVMAGRLLLAGFALSGFASLVYQVASVKGLDPGSRLQCLRLQYYLDHLLGGHCGRQSDLQPLCRRAYHRHQRAVGGMAAIWHLYIVLGRLGSDRPPT